MRVRVVACVAVLAISLAGCATVFSGDGVVCSDGWKPRRADVLNVAKSLANAGAPGTGALVELIDQARDLICKAYAEKRTKSLGDVNSVTVRVGGARITVRRAN